MTSSGASRDYINLLPDPADDDAWTTYVPTVEDIGDDPIFAFDGHSTAVEIPASVVDPDRLGTSFTVSTWMKHDRDGNDGKQQIFCAADGEGTFYTRLSNTVHARPLGVLRVKHPRNEMQKVIT